MRFQIISLLFLIHLISTKTSSIDSLTINHLKVPLGIDITDNNFAFKTEERGPFKAKLMLDNSLIEEKEVQLESSHSFTFDTSLQYNKVYKYVVESSTSKEELEFETCYKLEKSFIKPKTKNIFSPIFTKDFDLEYSSIKRARLYITGLGLYRAFINDQRVGNSYLTPGYNDYDYYLRYQTYNITTLLKENNHIEVHMGDGWYKGRFGTARENNKNDEIFGDEYKLCAHILIEYENGQTQNILTNTTWKVKHSQEVSNSIYDGEEIDFTLDNKTIEDVVSSTENYNLFPDFGSPIIEKEILNPELYVSPKGEQILDFHQNMVGFVRFKGNLNNNQELKISHGEVLQEKCFYNLNYRSAKPVLKYKGDGKERIYEPTFTYFGFRYALIEGLDKVDPKDFEGVVIYTDLEKTIECETDNEKINQLIHNAFWGQRGNFLDVPTDCPQRDERLGWTADGQIFSNTACFNMDSYNFYKKFIKDLRADQELYYNGDFPMFCPSLKRQSDSGGAVWADAGTIIPWNIYMNYGDKLLLKNSYPMMKDYVETLIKKDIDQGNKKLILEGFCYGDWLALDGVTETSTFGSTDLGYIMSVYYYVSVNIVSMTAKELGEESDYTKYNTLKDEIFNAILAEFFSPSGRLTVHTQTGYILSLYYKIYRDGKKDAIIKGFNERLTMDGYKLKTGFTGTPLILLALFDNGLDTDAYRFLYNHRFPGWIYAINLGATTIWERWNSLLEDGTISGIFMNSLNHYAYGSVCEAIYTRIVGIKNLSPGWKKVSIQPHLNYRLKKIKFSYNSISGRYDISWRYDETKFYINVTIPNGASAKIILPDNTEYDVNSGAYQYECNIDQKVLTPFTIDTPLFEILDNEEGNKLLSQLIPTIYYMATGENTEMLYGSIRLLSTQPFIGLTEEQLNKCQEELSKIRVVDYKIPDVIPPTDDTPTDESTDKNSKSNFLKNNQFVVMLSLIILFYF